MRRLVIAALLFGACSSGPTLGEYAEQVESLVVGMNGRIDAADAALAADETLDQARASATERVSARRDFIDELGDLDPPEGAAELHETTLDIMSRLTEAETAVAQLVIDADSLAELGDVWATPEGQAARAIDAETVALCLAAQEALDATAQRRDLSGVPWIPAEMTEVVQVTFGCLAEERRGD